MPAFVVVVVVVVWVVSVKVECAWWHQLSILAADTRFQ